MIEFIMDGKTISARQGDTVLDVARANDIFIPALCYHKAVSPYGACRVCLVEIEKRGRKRIVASCSYLAEDGIRVETCGPEAVKARNVAMELLLARCSENPGLRALARRMGVQSSRFDKRDHDCVLCGLCVRVCQEVIGASCMAFSGRGSDRHVTTPFGKPARQCVGCGACAAICPTGAIHQREVGMVTILSEWQTVLQRAECTECGEHFASCGQLDYIRLKLAVPCDWLYMCPACRRKRFSHVAAPLQIER